MRRPFDVAVCWCSVKSSGVVGSEGSERDQQKASQRWQCHTSHQHRRYLSKDIELRQSYRIQGFKKTCSWKIFWYYFFNLLPFPGTLSVTEFCWKYCMYYVSHSATCPAYLFFILSL